MITFCIRDSPLKRMCLSWTVQQQELFVRGQGHSHLRRPTSYTCASLRNVGQRLCCMSRCPEISRDVAESDAHQCISDLGGYIASHPRTYNHTVLLIILKFVRNICKLPKINTCHFNGPIEVQDLMQGGPHRYHFTSTRPTTRVTAIRTS